MDILPILTKIYTLVWRNLLRSDINGMICFSVISIRLFSSHINLVNQTLAGVVAVKFRDITGYVRGGRPEN